ncbi:hypothetical protein LXL04_026924 [Taraxacum kok-saghyz]
MSSDCTKQKQEALKDVDNYVKQKQTHHIDIPDFKDPYFEGRSNRKGGHITTEHHYHFDVFNEAINFQLQELDSRFNERVVEILELSVALDPNEGYKRFNSRLIRLVLTLPVSTATTERAFSAMKIVKNRLRNKMDDDFLADSLVLYIEKDIARSFSLDSILDDFNDFLLSLIIALSPSPYKVVQSQILLAKKYKHTSEVQLANRSLNQHLRGNRNTSVAKN